MKIKTLALYLPLVILVLYFGYSQFENKSIETISINELAQKLQDPKLSNIIFVDVREPHEYEAGHIKGMKNIPLSTLVLAIIFSIYYFIYKARKLDISMLVTLKYGLLFSFSVLSVYHFLSATFVEDNFIYHVLIGIYSLTNLILILVKRILSSYKSFFSVIVLF